MKDIRTISALRMIMIARGSSPQQMAADFEVSRAYIHLIQNGEKNMTKRTLKYGLDVMNIDMTDYQELDEFGKYLKTLPLSDSQRYSYMLIKAIGVSAPELKDEVNSLLEKHSEKSGFALTRSRK